MPATRTSGAVQAIVEPVAELLQGNRPTCELRPVETEPPAVSILLDLLRMNAGRSRSSRIRSLLFRLGTVLESEGLSELAVRPLELAIGPEGTRHSDRARMMVALGRVERRLGKYEPSLVRFAAAHAEAVVLGDLVTAEYALLGEAKTHILWGEKAHAEQLIHRVIEATQGQPGEWLVCWRDAMWDLAMLRERQGRMAERTVLLWRTLLAPFPLTDRTKMLGDLGIALRSIAEYGAARDCLVLVAQLATHQPIRVNAQIELLHLAADAGDDITYHQWRWNVQEILPSLAGSQRIDALTAIARSERVFGESRLAQRFLTMAVEEAMRQGHQWWIERLLALKKAEPRRHTQVRDPGVALVVQGLPAVLDELRQLAG